MPMTDIQETKERVHENIKEVFDTSSFMTFSQTFLYFIESWKKYFVFSGRANRTMFWSVVFFNCFFAILVGVIVGRYGAGVYAICCVLPVWAVAVRRLHDIGHTGLWMLAPMAFMGVSLYFARTDDDFFTALSSSLFLVSLVILLSSLCLKSDKENKYGTRIK